MRYFVTSLIPKNECSNVLDIALKNLKNIKDIGCVHDATIHGTEYDLTHVQELSRIQTLIEEIASIIYEEPLYTEDFWLSISEPNTSVISHNHMDGKNINVASCVLYLQASENCGELILEDYEITITPKVGDLVIFDSYCYHNVKTNQSNEDRICIAFDMKKYK